jgi:DNA repair protein RadA/Sms
MAKSSTFFVCQSCAHHTTKWMGKCPGCGDWNTLAEEIAPTKSSSRHRPMHGGKEKKTFQTLTEIQTASQTSMATGISELDRVLGGGLTPGSLVLIGGDPGIGKSTLLLQTLARFAQMGKKVLYVSGEESPSQIKIRAIRLGAVSDNFVVCSEICIEDVLGQIEKLAPQMVVFDSIQTFYTSDRFGKPLFAFFNL